MAPLLRGRRKRGPAPMTEKPVPCTIWETKIKPNLDLIEGWARRGYTEESMAGRLGMSYPTWWKAKKDHECFAELLARAKKEGVVLVENALFREATGYTRTEVRRTIAGYDSKGDPIVTEVVETKKFMRPNTTSQIFFLTNRNPERWKHTNKLLVGGDPRHPLNPGATPQGQDVGKLNDDELDQMEALILKSVGDGLNDDEL